MNAAQKWPTIYMPLATIVDGVCEVFGLSRSEFVKSPRRKTPKLPRGAFCIIASACSPASQGELGLVLQKPQGSVSALWKWALETQKSDPRFADLIQKSLTRALELMTERAGKSPGLVKTKLVVGS